MAEGAMEPDSTRGPDPSSSANESPRAIYRNVAANYLNLARATVLGLLVTPLLINHLGEAPFGVWSLVLGVSSYVGMVGAGLSSALVAKVATAEAHRRYDEVADHLRTAQRLQLGAAALGMALIIGLAVVFNVLFRVPSGLEETARLTLLLVGAAAMVTLVTTSWSAALVGTGRGDVTSLIGLITTTLMTVGQMAAALAGAAITTLGIIALATAFVALLANRRMVRRMLRSLPPGRVSRSATRSLVSLAGRDAMVVISSKIAFGSDVLIVGLFAGPVAAAAYAVAARASGFARDISNSACDVMLAPFSNAIARNDVVRARRLYESSIFIGLLLAIPLAIVFMTLGTPLLTLWLNDVPRHAPQGLAALGLLIVLQIPGHVIALLLMGAQRSNLLMRFTWPMAGLNVSISMIATMRWGVVGPAIGSIAAVLLTDPLLLRRALREYLDVSVSEVFKDLLTMLAVPTGITVGAILLLQAEVQIRPIMAPAVGIFIGLLFVLLTVVWLRLTHKGSYVAPAVRRLPIVGNRLERVITGRTQTR